MSLDDQALIFVPFASWKDSQATPRYQWDNHSRGHAGFVILQYTHSGCGQFRFGARDHEVPPGHAFIATVPEASRYGFPEGAKQPWIFSWINFYGALAVHLWSGLRERTGPVLPLPASTQTQLERLIRQARARRWKDPYQASEDAYRFYLEVMRHPFRRRTPAGPIDRSISYLRGHYQEALRVKEIAAMAGMSREHFTRLFQKRTGHSPAAFVRTIRLEAAARLLRSTQMPIKEIAFRSGFVSSTKLGLYFRRQHGTSLSDYRHRRARPPRR